ncbi:MAG: hypothetical protein ACXAC7_17910 [Candidatus Hodarchaeales archaeon]
MSIFSNEFVPILHRILDLSETIRLQQLPNWPRDSMPKSPIAQKLGLIFIPLLYPWWVEKMEIEYEQFGPFSPAIATAFDEIIETGRGELNGNELIIQPTSIEERTDFPEITEGLMIDLITKCKSPIISQFECLEIMSIISVEHVRLLRKNGILRRKLSIPTETMQKQLYKEVFKRMRGIPHLAYFIEKRGILYAYEFIKEVAEEFYASFECIQVNKVNLN